MSTKQIRDVEQLKEPFRTKCKAWLAENPEIFPVETFRTAERQAMLRRQSLSKVEVSKHQLGLACDIAFRGQDLYPSYSDPRWRKVADSAKKHGINWGYDMWEWDGAHFEDDGAMIHPLEYTPMTEAQQKQLIALTTLMSSSWHLLPNEFRDHLKRQKEELLAIAEELEKE